MLKKILVAAAGLALFAFILSKVDRHATWELLQHTALPPCFLGLLCFLTMVYLKGMRWSYLLKMQGSRYSVWNCFLIYMSSLYWGSITPGRAGDFVKVFYLKEDLGYSMGKGMSSVLVDRVFDLYILLILGGAGILVFPMPLDPRLIRTVWLFFAFLIGITLLAFNEKIGGGLIRAVFLRLMGSNLKEKTNQAFEDFHGGMRNFYKPTILYPIFLTMVSYLCFFKGCHLLAEAIQLNVSIFYLTFTIAVVNIVSLLTFLGMGTREGALIVLFGILSLSKETALAYSLLLFLPVR